MIRYVKARPTEYLVVARRGALESRGIGAGAVLFPGTSHVTVPSVKQEAGFAMTQESADGIPLRFKGIVVFRIVDPVQAAGSFDFSDPRGLVHLEELISHIVLGELRALVSHMTMQACIEGRKDTLATAVARALEEVASPAGGDGWGIRLEVVQIAQVFIVDDELRRRLEAEVRDAIEAKSERSKIAMEEQIETARLESQRRLEERELDQTRESTQLAEERLFLEQSLAAKRIETSAPILLLEIEKERERIEHQIELQERTNRLRELEVSGETIRPRAEQELEREILPLRQVPDVAKALSEMYRGANLSLYGADNAVVGTLAPLVEALTAGLSHSGRASRDE